MYHMYVCLVPSSSQESHSLPCRSCPKPETLNSLELHDELEAKELSERALGAEDPPQGLRFHVVASFLGGYIASVVL